MRWQFGGYYEPVTVACSYDLTKCISSFFEYIWFEIVTDVADCLANELILWRILGILLFFTVIIYLIHGRLRNKQEIQVNAENLKRVHHEIQDLELKVDILTYKVQYGIWPSPFLAKYECNRNKIQYTFPKPDGMNYWLKKLLTSTRKKKYISEKLINNGNSNFFKNSSNAVTVEKRYTSCEDSERETDDFDDQISLTEIKKYGHSNKNNERYIDNQKTELNVSKAFLSEMSPSNLSNKNWMELFATDNKNSHFQDISTNDKQDIHTTFKTQELKDGPSKRKELFSNCHLDEASKSFVSSTNLIPMLDKNEVEIFNVDLQNYSLGRNSENEGTNSTYVVPAGYFREDEDFSNILKKEEYEDALTEGILEKEPEYELTNSIELDSIGKTTSLLVLEALKFKKELLSKIEFKNDNQDIIPQPEETFACVNWNNTEHFFQPKLLDMITEESSGSSCKDKASEICIQENIESERLEKEDEKKLDKFLEMYPTTKTLYGENEIKQMENNSIRENSNVNESNQKVNNSEEILKIAENLSHDQMDISFNNDESTINKKLNISDPVIDQLTDTSSDTSVNRLIDKLVESERKCTSMKNISKKEVKKVFARGLFDHFLNSFDKMNNDQEDNSIIKYKSQQFRLNSENAPAITDTVNPLKKSDELDDKSSCQIDENSGKRRNINESKVQDNHLSEHYSALDTRTSTNQNPREKMWLHQSSDGALNERSIHKISNADEFKKRKNFEMSKSNSDIITVENPLNSTINNETETDKPLQPTNTTLWISLKKDQKSRRSQSDSNHSPGLRSLERNIPRILKNTILNSYSNQLAKCDSDSNGKTKLKARSNLNLSSIDSPTIHRRSRSFAMPRNISFDDKHYELERRSSTESLPNMADLCTPVRVENNDKEDFEEEREVSIGSLSSSSKSSSVELHSPSIMLDRKIPSRSLLKTTDSLENNPIETSSRNHLNTNNKTDTQHVLRRKSSTDLLKLHGKSKSCIPILKNRPETTRKNHNLYKDNPILKFEGKTAIDGSTILSEGSKFTEIHECVNVANDGFENIDEDSKNFLNSENVNIALTPLDNSDSLKFLSSRVSSKETEVLEKSSMLDSNTSITNLVNDSNIKMNGSKVVDLEK